MKTHTYTLILFFYGIICSSQVGIGNTQVSQDPSAALDVNSSTKKGLLIPRVKLGSLELNSNQKPIVNPEEGLLIFNNDTDINNLPGFYLRIDEYWDLLSSNDNKDSDIILTNNRATTLSPLNFSSTAFIDLNTNINNVAINSITESSINNNLYTLPKGNYSVGLTLNLQSSIPSNTGILGKDIHNSTYNFRVVDTAGNVISDEIIINSTSSAMNAGKHTIYVNMQLQLTQSKTIKLQIFKDLANSTYSVSTFYQEGTIHIRRGISK